MFLQMQFQDKVQIVYNNEVCIPFSSHFYTILLNIAKILRWPPYITYIFKTPVMK